MSSGPETATDPDFKAADFLLADTGSLDHDAILSVIGGEEPLSGPVLEQLFELVRSRHEHAVVHDEPSRDDLNKLLCEIGRHFPDNDWRNPAWRPYRR